MKNTIIIVTLFLVMSISAFGQPSDKKSDKDSKTKEQLMALIKEFADASVKADKVKLGRILHNDYEAFPAGGPPESKKMLFDAYKAWANGAHHSQYEAFEIKTDPKYIRIYDNMAIIRSSAEVKFVKGFLLKDQPLEQSYPTILTAVKKKDGRWQLLVTVFTKVDVKETKPLPGQ